MIVNYQINAKKQEKLIQEIKNGTGIFTKEDKKEKRWKNKVATFYYVRAFSLWQPSQTNHDGIIHNIKPIQ